MEYVYNSFSSNYKPWVSLTCVTFENELWLIIDMRLTATKSFKGILVCKLLKTSLWFFLSFFSIQLRFLLLLYQFFVFSLSKTTLPPPSPHPRPSPLRKIRLQISHVTIMCFLCLSGPNLSTKYVLLFAFILNYFKKQIEHILLHIESVSKEYNIRWDLVSPLCQWHLRQQRY